MTIRWELAVEALEGADGPDYEAARDARYRIERTHVVPEWMEYHFERAVRGEYKYRVRHEGRMIDVWSVSEKEAVNVIRFNYYGKTPMRDLAPFEVRAYLPNIKSAAAKLVGNAKPDRGGATPAKIDLLAQRLMKFAS